MYCEFFAPQICLFFSTAIDKGLRLQLNCAVKMLDPTLCPMTDLPVLEQCLCTNTTVQKQLALCVLETCNLEDQAGTSNILQTEICKGYPVPSRSAELIRDVIIIAAVTFPVVGLRFFARRLVVSKLWFDDWAILLATVSVVQFKSHVARLLTSNTGHYDPNDVHSHLQYAF